MSSQSYLGLNGWIEKNLPQDASGSPVVRHEDIHLVVRTYNICESDSAENKDMPPEYEKRIPQAVETFAKDWPHQLGFTFLQEAADRIGSGTMKVPLPSYVANLFSRHYPVAARAANTNELGIIRNEGEWGGDGEFEKLWELGSRTVISFQDAPFFSRQSYVMKIRLFHKKYNWAISLYNAHLAPGEGRVEVRTRQITRMLSIIQQNTISGELPPIVAGDFNFRPEERANYDLMNARFDLANEAGLGSMPDGQPHNVGINHIWIAKPGAYGAVGNILPTRWHTNSDNWGEHGLVMPPKVTDHVCPVMSFRIVDAAPHPDATRGAGISQGTGSGSPTLDHGPDPKPGRPPTTHTQDIR